MKKITVEIDGMMCQICKKHVEEALNNLADTTAIVNLEAKNAIVETIQDDTVLKSTIEKAEFLEMACEIMIHSGMNYNPLTLPEIEELEQYLRGKHR